LQERDDDKNLTENIFNAEIRLLFMAVDGHDIKVNKQKYCASNYGYNNKEGVHNNILFLSSLIFKLNQLYKSEVREKKHFN
jgi:hypothetical protein